MKTQQIKEDFFWHLFLTSWAILTLAVSIFFADKVIVHKDFYFPLWEVMPILSPIMEITRIIGLICLALMLISIVAIYLQWRRERKETR